MSPDDTIVAISSAVAPAARMILRLSGPASFAIVGSLLELSREAGVFRRRVRWREFTIPAWIYSFLSPRSATGEDVVEIHLPGNVPIVRSLLQDLIDAGARPAEPGEFTARAYFNGRIDLSQAEGVAATIAAANELELRAARQLLAGELARRLRGPMDAIAEALALVEVGIDFSEEDVSFLPPEQLAERIRTIDEDLDRLVRDSRRFDQVAHEPTVVLVGRPNAGKSTLLNALSGRERAVVSAIAGTTRDVIWAHVPLRRGIIRLIDVAGIELDVSDADSPAAHVAREMQSRALRAVESADVVVLVQEVTDARAPLSVPRTPDLIVRTKIDLASESKGHVSVSALTGEGLAGLRDRLDELAYGSPGGGSALALNDRHLAAVAMTREALQRIEHHPAATGEIVALELREALDALGSILGQVTPDDVLGRIFGSFCIGK